MINKKMISIVVMVYKNFSGLERTVDSVIMQNYDNIELIISDDGSDNYNDEYFDAIKEKCKDHFVNLVIQHNDKNVGTVKHFNKLIQAAQGDIVCPLSSGDIFITDDVIESISEHFIKTGCLICTAKRIEIGGNERVLPKKFQLKQLVNSETSLNHILTYGNFIGGATTYYSKEIFKKFGYFDERYRLCEDLPYFIKLLDNKEQISVLDKVTICYDLSGVSTLKNRNRMLDDDYVNIFIDILNNSKTKLNFFSKRALKYRIQKYSELTNKRFINLKFLDVVLIVGVYTIILNWRE